MIGCEKPRPGIGVFQSTFFVSLHSVGRFFSGDTPWLSGPRHCGQLDESDFAAVRDSDPALPANSVNRQTDKSDNQSSARFMYSVLLRSGR